ncbi:44942_t:CDS:2, partial [Gigaspora margarita]
KRTFYEDDENMCYGYSRLSPNELEITPRVFVILKKRDWKNLSSTATLELYYTAEGIFVLHKMLYTKKSIYVTGISSNHGFSSLLTILEVSPFCLIDYSMNEIDQNVLDNTPSPAFISTNRTIPFNMRANSVIHE